MTPCARCGLSTDEARIVVYNESGRFVREAYCGRCWLIVDGRPRGPYRWTGAGPDLAPGEPFSSA